MNYEKKSVSYGNLSFTFPGRMSNEMGKKFEEEALSGTNMNQYGFINE